MERRPELRRTMTLSEQLSAPDQAIRDFLKIPHDGLGGGDGEGGRIPAAAGASGGGGGVGGMINWKPLRDRLRLRRAASAWINKYNYSPGEAAAAFSRTFSRTRSLRPTPTFSRATSTRLGATAFSSGSRRAAVDGGGHANEDDDEDHTDDDDDDDEEEQGKDDAPAAQMSLMALLEQSDSQWDSEDEDDQGHGGGGGGGGNGGGGGGGGGARKNGDGDDDEDDGEGREEEMVHVCCVCMVRHKGAAFIPCGHTFCRLCSRELWVSRGNCPLCNGFIQEILDIF
ncbi:hypothetical protein OsI_04939 [Oryza sativa Indica Group]|uniref:RING-type domain-containing protein n=1 Tax=Oryza sativa subsp. indica TaxID=39946 RepID=B8A8H8_ORYSI|nr:hypothetical protein OsI_04939 [Oryza sativa Indica Group]